MAISKRSDLKMFSRFFQGCLERGIYFAPSQFETGFISTAHTSDDLKHTADVVADVVAKI